MGYMAYCEECKKAFNENKCKYHEVSHGAPYFICPQCGNRYCLEIEIDED